MAGVLNCLGHETQDQDSKGKQDRDSDGEDQDQDNNPQDQDSENTALRQCLETSHHCCVTWNARHTTKQIPGGMCIFVLHKPGAEQALHMTHWSVDFQLQLVSG